MRLSVLRGAECGMGTNTSRKDCQQKHGPVTVTCPRINKRTFAEKIQKQPNKRPGLKQSFFAEEVCRASKLESPRKSAWLASSGSTRSKSSWRWTERQHKSAAYYICMSRSSGTKARNNIIYRYCYSFNSLAELF